jgi:predicted Holliday junction resolvase-like endonuclease
MIFNKLKSSSATTKKIFIFGVLAVLCLALIFFVRYNFIKKVVESKELDLKKMLDLERLQKASKYASEGIDKRSKEIEEGLKKLQEESSQSVSFASSTVDIADIAEELSGTATNSQ